MAATETKALQGRTVGNYVVTGFLGEGGMGEVYVAEHPKIGKQVAMKVLGAAFSQQPQAGDRFLAEARAVARIKHANVIEIYDFGTLEDGRLYYFMELLKGRDLQRVLSGRGRLTAAQAWPYVEQICAGLQAAHESGIVHRDLKPENIFVLEGEPPVLKILDFGLARLIESGSARRLTSTGLVMGTPLFIAPEQAMGDRDRIGPRTDLYSLGVILYTMLAGQPPFSAKAPAALLVEHIEKPPPDLRGLAPETAPAIAALVHRCLEKNPLWRPDSARAVAEGWVQALGNAELGVTLPPVAASPPLASVQAVASTISYSVGEVAPPATETRPPLPQPRVSLLFWGGVSTLVIVVILVVFSARWLRSFDHEQPAGETRDEATNPEEAEAEKLSAFVKLLHAAERMHTSYEGYRRGRDKPCKELTGRMASVSSSEVPEGVVAAKALPSLPALDAAATRFANAYLAGAASFQEADKYYEQGDQIEDGCSRTKKLHAAIEAAHETVSREEKKLRIALESEIPRFLAARLERARREEPEGWLAPLTQALIDARALASQFAPWLKFGATGDVKPLWAAIRKLEASASAAIAARPPEKRTGSEPHVLFAQILGAAKELAREPKVARALTATKYWNQIVRTYPWAGPYLIEPSSYDLYP